MIQNGECEGGGFAGARLGDADKVAAGHDRGNGFCLDGGRRFVFFVGESARNRRGKPEVIKGLQVDILSLMRSWPVRPKMGADRESRGIKRHPAWSGLSLDKLEKRAEKERFILILFQSRGP
jgi:hypothetical protein